MRLYWAPQTRSVRAIWMLEEAGAEYELELVDIRAPDRRDGEAFRAASPMGKVPALCDGDAAMSESAAICLYVADRYAPGRLAPAVDDKERGRFLYWLPVYAGRDRAGHVRTVQRCRAESRPQRLG